MEVRVGTDIVEVERIRRLIAQMGDDFLSSAFTAAEIETCAGDARRLAGRWAAKECVMKVLGVGVDQVSPRDVEILRTPSGAPGVLLHGEVGTLQRSGPALTWSLSIAHENAYATAVAIAVPGQMPDPARPT